VSHRTLVVLGGLPATGKSTVAAELQQRARFAYVRIDTIEQALRESGELRSGDPNESGYRVGYAVARDLLRAGNRVLVECVNPIEITRRAWRDVAASSGADILEIELFCADAATHQRRVETRVIDIPGFELPQWEAVRTRVYEPWPGAQLRLDTTALSPAAAAERIVQTLLTIERRQGSASRG
jgi:predicted kinase